MFSANKNLNRSPLFYVGDKYKLMDQLLRFFPNKVNNYYEPFAGGGTVFLNVEAKKYFLNDIDKHLISVHKFLASSAHEPEKFFRDVERIIDKYNLSRSYRSDIVPESLKKKFKKTYYARFNKEGYERLREHVNKNKQNDPLVLYILLIYGFNRMMRFNGGGKFNLPVGNVDFNKNVANALNNYFELTQIKKIKFTSQDFVKFFAKKSYMKDDFVYLDPPYLVAASEYNKFWNKDAEARLLDLVDRLDAKRVKFALSNVTQYNGRKNDLLIGWMDGYNVHGIKSNYINYHNNTQKKIKEVLVTNY